MTKRYDYVGIRYVQGKGQQELLSFCASATDIRAWGGVPTKTERFHGGFQRALGDRYRKIIRFFDDGQTSPTSIVVAFRKGALSVTELGYPAAWVSPEKLAEKPSFVHLSFDLEVRDADTDDLMTLAEAVCEMLRPRLEASGDVAEAPSIGELGSDGDEEEDLDDEDFNDAEDESNGLGESGLDDDEEEETSLEIDVGQSKLRAFYDFLSNPDRITQWLTTENERYEKLKSAKPRGRFQREFLAYTPEQRLKMTLVSLLRPAMIVDGQHRVFGAYESATSPITFNVCAIKDSDWIEQVFQFVVLNKLAKPISSSFLTALLNTSLTNKELEHIEPRLSTVGISNTDRLLMKYLNFDENSPFYDMVAQPGDMLGVDNQGKLSDKGMLRIAKRWYNLSNNTSELRMFLPSLGEDQLTKARSVWKKHDTWTSYFYAFWRTLRRKYEKDGMWEKREKFNLLYIVTLMSLQDLYLTKKAEGDARFMSMDDFVEQTERFFDKVPGTFFKGWEATGLQSGRGPDHIKNAVMELRGGRQLAKVMEESPLFTKT